jgi:monofunctional biosynthetic peptidoglycan transglycosylase
VFRKLALGVCAAIVAALAIFWATLPDVRPLAKDFPATTAFMERRRASLGASGLPTRLEWQPVPISRIAPSMQRAVVAAEDARFWEHGGIDWDAIRTAALHDWDRGRLSHGGSTITQQLAKNLYLSPARTPWRKAKESAIALRLERKLTKRRILELYLNVVEFGPRTYGVEAAARRYFGKPAIALSPTESSTLAAMIPSPRIYDPVRHPKRVERRARRIRRWM